MTGTARIIRANSRNLPLEDDSVDLVVTSPPYFALRSYQDGGEHYAGQIGDEPTPAEFVDSLLEVTRECVRVLKPSGSLWVNLGDKYSQRPGQYPSGNAGAGEGLVGGARSDKHIEARRGVAYTAMQPKSLIGIPWRYALRCIDDLGLILRAEVIWSKPNGLPESVTDRVRRSHETWFHFTRQPRYFSAVDEIREATNPANDAHSAKYREAARTYGRAATDAHPRSDGNGNGLFTPNPLGKLPGSVWTVPTEPLRVPDHLGIDHFAAFPTEWPRRIIQGWSPAGVCVACGEGRRPVTTTERTARTPGDAHLIGHQDPRAKAQGRQTRASVVSEHTITGYACDCEPKCVCGHKESDHALTSPRWCLTKGGCDCASFEPRGAAPTRPAVVLDPFGGTGTTALVAKALGRHGISVDMSADYCRLAEWRTNDPGEIAKAMRVEKPPAVMEGQLGLFGEAS